MLFILYNTYKQLADSGTGGLYVGKIMFELKIEQIKIVRIGKASF